MNSFCFSDAGLCDACRELSPFIEAGTEGNGGKSVGKKPPRVCDHLPPLPAVPSSRSRPPGTEGPEENADTDVLPSSLQKKVSGSPSAIMALRTPQH